MKIKNIEDLKKSINWSTVLILILILCLSLAGLFFIHSKFLQKKALYDKQQIINIGNNYKLGLSEKLSIIASSTDYLDFLRSGSKTREKLYPQFLSQISTLKSKSIIGMEIINKSGKMIFNNGIKSSTQVTLSLCYLNQILDADMGICEYSWRLFFNKNTLLDELRYSNKSLKTCNNCSNYRIIDNHYLGSFPIKNFSGLDLMLEITEESDYFFYVYLIFMFGTLILFSIWSWLRLSKVLNNYISKPIKNLADCMSCDVTLEKNNNIEEIEYLINEINVWKIRVNKAREDEHAAKMSKAGAQFAHDIRSPLMAIDMIVKKIVNIPSDYKVVLQQAIERIAHIADNFLVQYRCKMIEPVVITTENIHDLVEVMISEMRQQYSGQAVAITLTSENFELVRCRVNAADFKRVISNMINNAVESAHPGQELFVDIKLFQTGNYASIVIVDNGRGIAPEILPKICDGISVGKINGTGMGLSHAKEKIAEWLGTLSIQSENMNGASVEIKLPLALN